MGELICYCFQYTVDDIKADYKKNGKSLILDKITFEKKKGGCDCANKNPKGKWCLSNVHRVVNEIKGIKML